MKLADEDKDRYLEEMRVWEAKQRGVNLKAAKVSRTLDWSHGVQFYFTAHCFIVFEYLGKKYRSTWHISSFITNVASLYLANEPDTYY